MASCGAGLLRLAGSGAIVGCSVSQVGKRKMVGGAKLAVAGTALTHDVASD